MTYFMADTDEQLPNMECREEYPWQQDICNYLQDTFNTDEKETNIQGTMIDILRRLMSSSITSGENLLFNFFEYVPVLFIAIAIVGAQIKVYVYVI